MIKLTISSPNTCALCEFSPTSLLYFDGTELWVEAYDNFTEYLTPEDAAAAALAIDPSYDVNNILGPLTLEPVNVSESPVTALYGTSVTLNSEYSCTDLTATVTYQWSGPDGNPIAGATSSSYTLTDALSFSAGTYTCAVSASNPDGQTGAAGGSFELIVIEPAATFNLTRSSTNIASGFITALRGFSLSDCSLYLVESGVTITYDALTNGFETTGGELGTLPQTFEIFINGAFARSFTLPALDGTYSFHL
jgi:hypothetical protein